MRAKNEVGGLKQPVRFAVVEPRIPRLFVFDHLAGLSPVPEAVMSGGGHLPGIEAGEQPLALAGWFLPQEEGKTPGRSGGGTGWRDEVHHDKGVTTRRKCGYVEFRFHGGAIQGAEELSIECGSVGIALEISGVENVELFHDGRATEFWCGDRDEILEGAEVLGHLSYGCGAEACCIVALNFGSQGPCSRGNGVALGLWKGGLRGTGLGVEYWEQRREREAGELRGGGKSENFDYVHALHSGFQSSTADRMRTVLADRREG